MRKFKIRASATYKIMTEPRSKSEFLSKTCISYLEEWKKEQIYGRKKEFRSKYTDKGNWVENEAIAFASEYLGWGMVFKNEDPYSNDFITGTPDLVLSNEIIDIKSSWDCFTFPLFDEGPCKEYWWQLQSYMALTDKDRARLIYCLMDTPDELIEREARNLVYKEGFSDITEEFYEEVSKRMKYDNIQVKYRIKAFEIFRDEKAISEIEARVLDCRAYLESLEIVFLSENTNLSIR